MIALAGLIVTEDKVRRREIGEKGCLRAAWRWRKGNRIARAGRAVISVWQLLTGVAIRLLDAAWLKFEGYKRSAIAVRGGRSEE